ncbi:MAG: ATP-binding protein [Bauldia sp.]
MASRQPDLYGQVLATYAVFAGFLLLVVFASPFFLIGAVAVFGYRLHRAYQHSPKRLARVAHEKSLVLYQRAQALIRERSVPDAAEFSDDLYRDFIEVEGGPRPTQKLQTMLLALADYLYGEEGLTLQSVPEPPSEPALLEDARYQDAISRTISKLSTPDVLQLAQTAIAESVLAFIRRLPPIALRNPDEGYYDEPEIQFTVPLIDACSDMGATVDALVLPFYAERLKKTGLFAELREQIDQNLRVESGVGIEPVDPSKLTFPPDHPGTPAEIVSAYLRHTPFPELFDTPLPFNIDEGARIEHWHLIAGSGHGKTQTLQHIIANDLRREVSPALIIVDSQGDMLRKLERLALFQETDRLVIVDPEDDCSPALNMFDVKTARLEGYSRAIREQVEATIIELFNYVFGALASDLTAKQGTAFAYITRLMLAIPGATIHTFRELMETNDPTPFASHIAKLDPTARAFFSNQFFNKTAFGETRQQIARRLYTVLQVPAFERMFAAPTNRFDMFAAMQSRKVVLINTSKALLKTDASALFGRYMIALTLNAAFERVAIPESQRVPAYLVVDEAAEYFDINLERLLAQARKFKLGVLFAHQHMDQLSPALRSAVAANTSIKMAGGVSDHDARLLAPDMRTTANFIAATRKHDASSEFACYIRNRTTAAVRLSVPFGTVEGLPRMSAVEHRDIRQRNRERYGVEAAAASEPPPEPPEQARQRRDPDDVDMRATEN